MAIMATIFVIIITIIFITITGFGAPGRSELSGPTSNSHGRGRSRPQPQGGGKVYGHALRGPPPPPPSMVYGPGCPPLLWDGVWVPSSPCGVVVGVLGFWV